MSEHGPLGPMGLTPSSRLRVDVPAPGAMPAEVASPDEASVSVAGQMFAALPTGLGYDRDVLRACIEAGQDCAQAATSCADACLAEEMVEELIDCIRTLLNVADVCEATARVLSRRSGPDHTLARALLGACWTACRDGRVVCEEFLPIHDYCRVCARACRQAERACRTLLSSLP